MLATVQSSLNHIRTRKLLDCVGDKTTSQDVMDDKELCGHSGIGSDGETSDYQRSTPSPRDSSQRITELGSEVGSEKSDLSPPDLGFVDFAESCGSNSIFNSSSSINTAMPSYSESCVGYGTALHRISLDAGRQKHLPPVNKNTLTASILLNKKLKVEVEKLPSVVASVVNSNTLVNHSEQKVTANNTLGGDRKRYILANTGSLQRTSSVEVSSSTVVVDKKYPRFVSDHQKYKRARKSGPSGSAVNNKTLAGNPGGVQRTKEILLTPNLFNSFRITKQKSTLHSNNKSEPPVTASSTHSNSIVNFETANFYKLSSPSSLSPANTAKSTPISFATPIVHKQNSDLITSSTSGPPRRSPTAAPFKKTELLTGFPASGSTGCSSSRILEPKLQPSCKNVKSESLDPLVCNVSRTNHNQEGSETSLPPVVQDTKSPTEVRGEEFDADNFALPRKLRFPVTEGSPGSGAITCKWDGCHLSFKAHGKLSDHIKTEHVVAQLEAETVKFSCLWAGCKVYGKSSSSRGWLEKHVPLHGGKFAFPCIVEGCKSRFSSQAMLERHVNSHFEEPGSGTSNTKDGHPRKNIEGAPARKRLKRAGVKLKFRELPFSARIFDFFDAGMMSGIRHQVADMEQISGKRFNMKNDCIKFRSKAISLRKDPNGLRQVQLKWLPKNLLPDEWVPLEQVVATKTVKICNLPEKSKALLYQELLFQPKRKKQSRKNKRVEEDSVFLTPDELKEKKESEELKRLFL